MRLVPDQPGAWKNPDHAPGTPGLYAVVLGVSAYAHLQGGTDPAADTWGLGQLFVSALTASEVFRWLDSEPEVAAVWAALSPGASEKQADPTRYADFPPADFATAKRLIRQWKKAFRDAPAGSTALFFFSGHGVEQAFGNALLFPADWPESGLSSCIAVGPIRAALRDVPSSRQIFLLDACRSNHKRLRAALQQIDGILDATDELADGIDDWTLYAASPGEEAWAPRTPADGPSLFGASLLEGLRGTQGLVLRNANEIWTNPLADFVAKRVTARIAAATSQIGIAQRVRADGFDLALTRIAGAAPAATQLSPIPVAPTGFVAEKRSQRLKVHHKLGTGLESTYSVYGHEDLTQAWLDARLTVVATGEGLPHRVEEVRRDPQAAVSRVTVQVGARRHLLRWFAVGDMSVAVPPEITQLELEVGWTPEDPVASLLVNPGLQQDDELGEVARMWASLDDGEVSEAYREVYSWKKLEDIVMGKQRAPLAALIASTMLVRARQWSMLRDWTRNLGRMGVPDGWALWARTALDAPEVEPFLGAPREAEAVRALTEMEALGQPWTADGLAHAISVCSRLRGRPASLERRLREAQLRHEPGGLLAVYNDRTPPEAATRWFGGSP